MLLFILLVIYKFTHFFFRIFCPQYGSADGYAFHARSEDFVYILCRDASDGHHWEVDACLFHALHYGAIAVDAEYWSKVFLCGGVTVRAAAYIVGSLLPQSLDVVKSVCRSTYYIFLAQHSSGFIHWHVVLAEMYAVGSHFLNKMYAVVEQEYRIVRLTHRENLGGGFPYLVV